MSVGTTEHSPARHNDGEVEYVDLVAEPDRTVGEYVPLRRVMGFVAASAAADELLGRVDGVLRAAASPEPPSPPKHDKRDEDETLALAA